MAIDLQQTQGQMFGPAGTNHAPGLVPDPGSSSHSPPYVLGDDGSFHPITGGGGFVFVGAGAGHAAGLVPDPGATSHTPPYYLGDDAAFHPLWMVANVMDYGATGNGVTDDTSAIKSAITALPANGGTLYFPAGTYLISSTLAIPSNTKVLGEGWGSTIKGVSSFPNYTPFHTSTGVNGAFLLTNNNYSSGNTNLIVQDIAFDFSNDAAVAGTDCIHFRNVTHSEVVRVRTFKGNDGIAHTASNDYRVEGCHALSHSNCGIDQWDGVSDGIIIGNTVDAASTSGSYGILVTGVTTQNTSNTSYRMKVIGNTVRNVDFTGIWIQGGQNGSSTGSCQNCVVDGNTVDTASIGIRVSESTQIAVSNNSFSNCQNQGIYICAELSLACTDPVITGNVVASASLASLGAAGAIELQNTTTGGVVTGNSVVGTDQSYSILLDSGATGNWVSNNIVATGQSGAYLNSGGTSNILLFDVSGVVTCTSTMQFTGAISQLVLGENGVNGGQLFYWGATSGSNQLGIDTTGGALRTTGALGSNTELFSGLTGTSAGSLLLLGTSGVITIQPQAAAGTYNFNLPTTAGTAGQFLTSQGGSSSAMTWTSVGTFQNWTPTLSSQTGTLGTTTINTARYTQVGNQVNFYLDISITSAGSSPAGYFQFTLPVTPAASVVVGSCAGLETNATTTIGGAILGSGSGSIGHLVATGASPNIMLNGNRIVAFGMYET